MGLPETLSTARLHLRRPLRSDAAAVFRGWAGDAEATAYMSWPTHLAVADAETFIELSDEQWSRRPGGPYLIERLSDRGPVGSCGFGFSGGSCAEIGYIIAREHWGFGYATECLGALVALAGAMAPIELFAHVHPENSRSIRVLQKCGFESDGGSTAMRFPNLADEEVEARRFSLVVRNR